MCGNGLLLRARRQELIAGSRIDSGDFAVDDSEAVGHEKTVVLACKRLAGVRPGGLGNRPARELLDDGAGRRLRLRIG